MNKHALCSYRLCFRALCFHSFATMYSIYFSDQMQLYKNKERKCTYILEKKINIIFYFPVHLRVTDMETPFFFQK